MYFITVLFDSVAFACAVKQELHKLPQDKISNFEKVESVCAPEYNVNTGILQKIADGTLQKDEATNKYLHCVALKTGLFKDDGHMVVDKIAGLLGNYPLVKKFKEALIKCNEVTKEDPVATVVEMNRCYSDTTPVRFSL